MAADGKKKGTVTRAERRAKMLGRAAASADGQSETPVTGSPGSSIEAATARPRGSTAEARRARRLRIARRATLERIAEVERTDQPDRSDAAGAVGRRDDENLKRISVQASAAATSWSKRRLSESLGGFGRGFEQGAKDPSPKKRAAVFAKRATRSKAMTTAADKPTTLSAKIIDAIKGPGQRKGASALTRLSKVRKGRRIAAVGLLVAVGSALALGPVLLIQPFSAIVTSIAAATPRLNGAALGPVELEIAMFLMEKGLDPIQVAAVMGNMKAESGMDPTRVEANGTGIGLCQWSFGRADALREFAASQDKDWRDLGVQLEFFWEHDEFHKDWSASYRVSGGYENPSPAPGTLVHGSKGGFISATDVRTATEQFCYGWERAGFPRIDVRVAFAESFYAALASGGGQDYASATDRQKAVADTARASTYGTSTGWCQAWVCKVYAAAGESGDSRCCAHAAGDAWIVSTSMDGIPVGATVYVSHSVGGVRCGCGRDAGHVGIYIGAGQVASRRGGDAPWIETLQSFADNYGRGGWMGWGWNGGIPLNTPDEADGEGE